MRLYAFVIFRFPKPVGLNVVVCHELLKGCVFAADPAVYAWVKSRLSSGYLSSAREGSNWSPFVVYVLARPRALGHSGRLGR